MSDQLIISVFIIALVIQAYMIFQMNIWLVHLRQLTGYLDSLQLKIPNFISSDDDSLR
jgi:hypothetical protein